MEDIGYSCCSSVPILKELLQQFPKLKEQDVALIVGTMARTHTAENPSSDENAALAFYTSFSSDDDLKDPREPKSWDVSVFVDAIKDLVIFYFFLFTFLTVFM
jgi:hypothetical protein